MHASVLLLLGSLFYLILTMFIYFSKERLNNKENRIYKYILFVSCSGIILDLFGIYASLNIPDTSLIRFFALKFYYQYLITALMLFTIYIFLPTLQKSKESWVKGKRKFYIVFFILSMLNIILPFSFHREGNIIYAEGLNPLFLYITAGLIILSWTIYIILNYKKINTRRLLPIIIFIIFSVPVIYYQMLNPEALLVTALITFITIYMFYTIENPDIKMIDELEKNKSLVESSIEDKSIFLFKLFQEIDEPLKKILKIVKNNDLNNLEKEDLLSHCKNIEYNVENLNFIVNNIINITTMDSSKFKVINNSYNVKTFFELLKKNAEGKLQNKKDIELNFDISPTIPDELYGDNIKLKQVLNTIIDNSIKYTNSGLIELEVDSINRYDLSRLIIKIRDTGCGMTLDQINEILTKNYEFTESEYEKIDKLHLTLDMAIKVVRLLGGNSYIKSDLNRGTEVTIILDQKVKNDKSLNNNMLKYQNNLFNKKVLIVDDDSEIINKIVKFLSKEDIKTNISMYGNDCYEKVKTGEKYKLILMDDEMKPDNGLPTLQKLQKLKKFNIPVIVMINKEKEFIKQHYIKDGFVDVIIKDNLNNELKRIVDKYLR